MNSVYELYHNRIAEYNTVGIELFNLFILYLDASPKTIDTYTKAVRQLFNYFSFNGITKPKRGDILAYPIRKN